MTERLNGSFENHNTEPDNAEANQEVSKDVKQENKVETKVLNPDEARKDVEKARKQELETLDESARSASRIIQVPLQAIQPVVETVTKTWNSIRQNLSPAQRNYSKIIHNPVVANISEFTARTLARPYAILSGSIFAVIGSGIYLYLTRHLGYQYNYFVPILLFAAGLGVGIIAEAIYMFVYSHRKSH